MSELAKKFHLQKKDDGTIEDITAYTTLEEVNGQGIPVNLDGIDGYIAYGTEGELSRLKYQKQKDGQVYNVLKTAKPPMPRITLKAYRNDDSFMQNLRPMEIPEGEVFYLNKENVQSLSGYDYVCCTKNNFRVTEDEEIKVYYIPQTVPDRVRAEWGFEYYGVDFSGGVTPDLCNTRAAQRMSYMFSNAKITKLPHLCTDGVKDMTGFLSSINSFTGFDLNYLDTTVVENFENFFASTLIQGDIIGSLDLSHAINVKDMFNGAYVRGLHLKNVPRSLDFSNSGGTEGTHYIIDNYID